MTRKNGMWITESKNVAHCHLGAGILINPHLLVENHETQKLSLSAYNTRASRLSLDRMNSALVTPWLKP